MPDSGWSPSEVSPLVLSELVALNVYTQIDYAEINSALRGVTTMTPANKIVTDFCVDGLAKLPPFKGMVTRGTNLPTDKDKSCVTNGTMTDKAFIGTSATKPFPGAHHFTISCNGAGRDVSFLSRYPEEGEVLFPPNQKFHIKSRQGTVETDPTKPMVNHGVKVVLDQI